MEDFYDFLSSFLNRLRLIPKRSKFLTKSIESIHDMLGVVRLGFHGFGNLHRGNGGFVD
ncbi:hypothetical protein D3C81_965390 [compost metagenome]